MFCDTPLQPSQRNLLSSSSEEHVYARWYRDNVVNNKIKMFTATLAGNAELLRQPPLQRLVNTSVCVACNTGWMSQLETAVAPIFDTLINGGDVRDLTPAQITVLSRWAGKTTAVLSYVTPQKARVPHSTTLTLHPDSIEEPKMRVFYAQILADLTLEGGFLQIMYGRPELGLIGSEEVCGTRITLCVYNHLLTVDFPPMMAGVFYDLSESCSAQIWPRFTPAGSQFALEGPALISDVLLAISRQIKVGYSTATLRA